MTKVSRYLKTIDLNKIMVSHEDLVINVIKKMVENDFRVVIVTNEEKKVVGIITASDIMNLLVIDLESPTLLYGSVFEISNEVLGPVEKDTYILEILRRMKGPRFDTLIVREAMTDNTPIGIITDVGIMQWWLENVASKILSDD